jgi:hypothetical protein
MESSVTPNFETLFSEPFDSSDKQQKQVKTLGVFADDGILNTSLLVDDADD